MMDLPVTEVRLRQELFCSTVRSHFLAKITKYQNVLMKNGIHLHEQNLENGLKMSRTQSFEEHIELVIGTKSVSPNAYKSLWKMGNRISVIRVFRWIYELVQRTKSTRILHHLDGVPETEIQSVILTVAWEIATAYEYQLCTLEGEAEIVQLGQHAVLCMLAYLNTTDAHFGPEELIQAVLEVKPQSSRNKDILKTKPVTHNRKQVCLRWRLSQVLKQPGLRIRSPVPTHRNSNPTQGQITVNHCEKVVNCDFENKNKGEILASVDSTLDGYETAVESKEQQIKYQEEPLAISDIKVEENESCRKTVEKTHEKVVRTISTFDMDFEEGFMKVTDHYCEVSDFSPLENSTSLLTEENTTPLSIDENDISIDEELTSDIEEEIHDDITNLENSDSDIVKKTKDRSENRNRPLHNDETDNASFPVNLKKPCKALNDENTEINLKCNKTDDIRVETTNRFEKSINPRNNIFINEECNAEDNEPTTLRSHVTVDAIEHVSDEISEDKLPLSEIGNIDLKQRNDNISEDLKISHITENSRQHLKISGNVLNNPQKDEDTSNIKHPDTIVNVSENEPVLNGSFRKEFSTHKSEIAGAIPDVLSNNKEHTKHETPAGYKFYGCFTPYGAKCRPQIYGFRGPLHVWNETEKKFTLIYNDSVTVATLHKRQVPVDHSNFHQKYVPTSHCEHS